MHLRSAARTARTRADPDRRDQGVLEISRFSCRLFLQRLRVFRLRRTEQPLAKNVADLLLVNVQSDVTHLNR
jgi:hypothetical protein